MWSPVLSESDEGVLPANAPSISMSAPAGVDETSSLAAAISGALIATAVGAAIAAGAALAAAAARAAPFSGQSLLMALQASSTDPPSDIVEWLTIESPS